MYWDRRNCGDVKAVRFESLKADKKLPLQQCQLQVVSSSLMEMIWDHRNCDADMHNVFLVVVKQGGSTC